MWIKLLKPWRNFKAGQYVNLSAIRGMRLIKDGVAKAEAPPVKGQKAEAPAAKVAQGKK